MTVLSAADAAPDAVAPGSLRRIPRLALLGCGNVGSAFAALASTGSRNPQVTIRHVLVRDASRPRPTLPAGAALTTESRRVLDSRPDVLVELLGGLEPARTIVLDALQRGIPVVTANKSLIAAHGAELRAMAARTATPLLYEAAVIAGVPFLGSFSRRPHALNVSGLVGIVNGTSNYVLTRARDERCSLLVALEQAQLLGLAEPDPGQDVDGIDAVEKLVVLLQVFGGFELSPKTVETEGIRGITLEDIEHARALGGTIKPVILADWSSDVTACSGPAFVPASNVLASVDRSENALALHGPHGRIVLRGPGAGPAVTAATVMDDVHEATRRSAPVDFPALQPVTPGPPETGWFIRLTADQLSPPIEIADLLASHGVFVQRSHGKDGARFSAVTLPSTRGRIESALRACRAATGCATSCLRALED